MAEAKTSPVVRRPVRHSASSAVSANMAKTSGELNPMMKLETIWSANISQMSDGPARQKPAMTRPPMPMAIMKRRFLPNTLASCEAIETATRNARPFETRNGPSRSSRFTKYLK